MRASVQQGNADWTGTGLLPTLRQLMVSAQFNSLPQGPAIPMIRRHTKGDKEIHFQPALTVVSGNFVAAKRRGVVDGTNFGLTGEVRLVHLLDVSLELCTIMQLDTALDSCRVFFSTYTSTS